MQGLILCIQNTLLQVTASELQQFFHAKGHGPFLFFSIFFFGSRVKFHDITLPKVIERKRCRKLVGFTSSGLIDL